MEARENDGQSTAEAGAIQALACGLQDSGVSLVTGYPGFHAHELVEFCGGSFSVNERTAFGIAWGASAAGARTAVAIKNVGLNDAADPFLNAMRLRITGGMAVVVFDDIEVAGSQCRQDSRPYFDLAPGLWFEPVDVPHAYRCAREAIIASERFGIPVVIRVTNPLLRLCGRITRAEKVTGRGQFHRNPGGQVAHPVNARGQERAAVLRQSEVAEYVEGLYAWPHVTGGDLKLVVGAAAANAPATPDRRTLWTYPLPYRGLGEWLSAADGIDVYELGSPVVSGCIRATGGARLVRFHDPAELIDHSGGYRESDAYEALFAAIRSCPVRVVCGDLGSYTMDPARTIDVCLCYGAALPIAAGCALGAPDRTVFCVTGDAAFLHSGQACLHEVRARGARVVLIVIDNGCAASTGGQVVPGAVRTPGGTSVTEVEHSDTTTAAYRRILGRLAARPGLSLLRVRC